MKTGRFHLTLTLDLWNALAAEASRRGLSVSAAVRERLALSLGAETREGPAIEPPVIRRKQARRQCRLWLEAALWDRLSEAAARQGVTVPVLIREQLRHGSSGRREVPLHEAVVLSAPEPVGTLRMKQVPLFDLSE